MPAEHSDQISIDLSIAGDVNTLVQPFHRQSSQPVSVDLYTSQASPHVSPEVNASFNP